MKTLVVVNPNSSNSHTGREWPTIRGALQRAVGEFDEHLTAGPDDATGVVRAGLRDGFERIVVVGGDGTNNEVVNGFFDGDEPINPGAVLGFVPRGTGGDLRKTLGIGRKLADCLPVLQRNNTRPVDVGRTTFENNSGEQATRYFINITSFGIGGLVDKIVNESSKALGGKVSFFIGTFRAMLAYRNKAIRLKVDDHFDEVVVVNNIAVANGQYLGGGMWIAPEASPDDGLFDVIILGDFTTLDLILQGSTIYKGTHIESPKVRMLRGRHVEATCNDEVLIDMDGEQPGHLPITLDVVPKAIKLIAP